jgi:signal transduction histidine kinase
MRRPDPLHVHHAVEPVVTLRGRPHRRSLLAQTALITCATALISVVVTALIAFPVGARTAETAAKAALQNQAGVLAGTLAGASSAERNRVVQQLGRQGIEVYLVTGGRIDRAGPPQRTVRQIAQGTDVPAHRAMVGGRVSLLAGAAAAGTGGGVLLAQRPPGGLARTARSLWYALLAGLAAGVVAGALLARRIARPIRDAAAAARRLSAGERGVRLTPTGPTEVAQLAESVNQLAAALATSEGRQRDFLLSVSHELRTPLTTIRGYAEALADGVIGGDGPAGIDGSARAGRTMLDEANRLDRLIADLLVLARVEATDLPLELLEVDLTELAATAAEAWAARCAAAGLVLGTELPAGPVPVHTDPGRIRQVLDNLLENALRVLPAGAPLVVAVRAESSAGSLGGSAGVVEIRDGGPGFTDDDLAVAFERGALSQRYAGVRPIGSGLGLALAARLVRRLGGQIDAGHAPEGGARFTIRLPYTARTRD